MIGYVTLGTNDLPRALAFYDALLPVIGAGRLMDSPKGTGRLYGTAEGAKLSIGLPFEGAASPGNGTMVALAVADRSTVDAAHAKALGLGGADEGTPGERGGGFYGAYCRDLDGNKLCFFLFEGNPGA